MRFLDQAAHWGEVYPLRCILASEEVTIGIRGPSYGRALVDFLAGIRAHGWVALPLGSGEEQVVVLSPAGESWRPCQDSDGPSSPASASTVGCAGPGRRNQDSR